MWTANDYDCTKKCKIQPLEDWRWENTEMRSVLTLCTYHDGDRMSAEGLMEYWKEELKGGDDDTELAIVIVRDELVDAVILLAIRKFMRQYCERIKYLTVSFHGNMMQESELKGLFLHRVKLRGVEVTTFGEPYKGELPNGFLYQKNLECAFLSNMEDDDTIDSDEDDDFDADSFSFPETCQLLDFENPAAAVSTMPPLPETRDRRVEPNEVEEDGEQYDARGNPIFSQCHWDI
mmetsp:Transcript_8952/g.14921  ORF Transcript_8952/g.14921 Transcript_8952/m.14921 type:complete len:234 (-) Transcript_8952:41-742(-)|eukprot:CAMPEP_0119018962 /NCGR_PEP_ID=MMETSP1176-20130426/20684_1 /TAXON_ID=265551 /ORGANISM="Synedropsis recta cf, Strain CCMP1620" /LENGTH=233 /DNA_ID=CAMNT_0006973079 /DNA_START=72 /DNA_END=773 /DNA_ORIENTATION=+